MIDVHGGDERDPGDAPGPAIGGGAATFARAIARRALARRVRRAPIARVLRRAARALPRRRAPAGVTFAPVLRFTVRAVQGREQGSRARVRSHDPFVPRVARVLTTPAPQPPAPLAVAVPAAIATGARLAARGRRSDGGGMDVLARMRASVAEPARAHVAARSARPVARVLRAPAPVPDAAIAQEPVRAGSMRTNGAAVAPTLSASEVNRLTEHVLRTMDRRISAFRERQGRS